MAKQQLGEAPSVASHAATKKYVDDRVGTALTDQRTTNTSAINSTTLVEVLTITLPVVGTYYFQGFVQFVGNGTTHVAGINIDGTCTPSSWRWSAAVDSATAANSVSATSSGTTTFSSSGVTLSPAPATATTLHTIDVRGRITVTATGTLTIKMSRISGTGTFTVNAGSSMFAIMAPPGNYIEPAPVTLTDAATIATDASRGNHFRVTLGGNRTLGAPTNPVDGKKITYEIIQDATGSRTLSYNSVFTFGVDVPSPTLTTTANARDFLGFIYNSAANRWYCLAVAKGY